MAKILIVDDEEFILGVLSNIVESAGHTPSTIARGDKAIEMFTEDTYDLLISDIRMSPVDGFQVLAAARKAQPEMPVIMLTAYASEESRLEAEKMGAFAYLTKPFNVQTLVKTIAQAVARPSD